MDTSVVLRVVLGHPNALREWRDITRPVTSVLTEVECLRTLDRRFRRCLLSDEDVAERRGLAVRLLERMERVELTAAVLRRAAEPFPTPLGTLDAIHLSTLVTWAAAFGERPTLVTHDTELSTAAQAMGFSVLGA